MAKSSGGAGRIGRSGAKLSPVAKLTSGTAIDVRTPRGIVHVTPNDFFAGTNMNTRSFQTFTLRDSRGKKIQTIDTRTLRDWLGAPGVSPV